MSTREEQYRTIEELKQMREEDDAVPWFDDPNFQNFTTSRDDHHRPIAMWAGALTPQLGAHRRGPVSNH